MKKILVCLLVCAAQTKTVSAQVNMGQFIPENMFPLLNANDILDVKFQWNMKGKLQASLNEGINNLHEGNPGPASHDMDEVIHQDSTLWVAYYYRGIAKKNLHKLEESGSDFLTAQRLAPTVAETHFELGLLYQDFRVFTEAKKEYAKALELNPGLVQARYSLGGLSVMTRDLKDGLKQFQKCNEIDPKFASAYMAQGILKFKARKNDNESIVWFNKALAVDSTLSNAYFWRGLAYSSLNQPEKCLPDWNKAVRFNPTNSFVLIIRGYLLTELHKFDEAFSDFRKSISFDDSNLSMHQLVLMDKDNDVRALMKYLVGNGYGLAPETFDRIKKSFCLLLARRYPESLQSAEAVQKRETNASILFLKGVIYDRYDRPDSAIMCFNAALELDNDIFEIHKKRGEYFAIRNDWTRASLDFKEMARIDPTSTAPLMPSAYNQRGRMKYDQHDYVGAILDLTEYLKAAPSAWGSYFLRADARIHLGDFVTASEDLQRIASHLVNNLEVQKKLADNCMMIKDTLCALSAYKICAKLVATPTLLGYKSSVYYEIHFGLARAYTEMKQWDQADAQLDTVRKSTTNANFKVRTDMHYYRGKLEYSMSNYTKAIDQFEDVLHSEPGNFDAQYYMAKACQALGQKQRARSLFKQINGYLDSGELYVSLSK